ncbi:MAG: ABC transporter ATP-binding protein/permease [Planctomycetia bacterium]|nr:ABC transporter ATP-binding protein/permease [Planctomycetia bacterium]
MSNSTTDRDERRSKTRLLAKNVPVVDHGDEPRDEAVRPLQWSLIAWIASFTQAHARKRNRLLVFVVLRSLQLPVAAWAIGRIIEGPISHGSIPGLMYGVGAYLALAAFTNFTLHFRQRLALELGEAVVQDLRNTIFDHLQRQRMAFFNRTKLGRIISRTTSDVEAVRAGIQDVFFDSIVGSGQILGAAALMAWYDVPLFLVVVGLAPVLWCINLVFRKRLSQVHREVHESFSRITSSLAESVNGIEVTQSFVRQDVNAERFADLIEDHSQYNLKAARTAGSFLPLLEFNNQIFLALLLGFGGYRVLDPEIRMPIGDLIQFFFLANILFQPIQALGEQYNSALTAMAGAERIRELLQTPTDWQDPPDVIRPTDLAGRVEFIDVTFGYDPDVPVLHGISFTAEPCRTIALVGHTGSGKTSIINLVAKFYLPTEGRLLIDGLDVRHLDTDALHHRLGIVLQQNFLFSGTVMENIRTGKPTADDDEVRRAVAQMDCTDLLESLPAGFATEVGENGCNLSLGQRQIICFARAMLADPRILILDEATSSIDVLTEARIQHALAKLLAGRTAFVVAHRLSTIRNADLVLVLDRGRIAERGTHDQLVQAGGLYRDLYHEFIRATAA